MLRRVADIVAALPGRVIVAVDGVDGAGKTTFADRLKPLIEEHGRPVVRSSVDGFHNPRAIRYRRGPSDPLGFFLDSFNYAEVQACLIDPFRQGAAAVAVQRFDHRLDRSAPVEAAVGEAAILVLDGIFLHRDELRRLWDFSVFLNVPFAQSFQRMAIRDGGDPDPEADSNRRYHRGQLIYLDLCKPNERADLVIDG